MAMRLTAMQSFVHPEELVEKRYVWGVEVGKRRKEEKGKEG